MIVCRRVRNSGLLLMALLVACSVSYVACGSPEREFGETDETNQGTGGQDAGDDAPSSNNQ